MATKGARLGGVYWVKERKETDPLKRATEAKKAKEYTEGNVFRGEWKNDKRHGFGVMIWSNGNKYEGEWRDGYREGQGVFWVKDGTKLRKLYAGSWRRGLKEGKGVFFGKPAQGTYEGEWKSNMREGKGTAFFSNGDVYIGQWHHDNRCGLGTLTKANKDVYEGEWLDDKREGAGVFYFKEKQMILDGEWVNDMPKCGVYVDASEFFGTDGPPSASDDTSMFQRRHNAKKKIPLPKLQLRDPDGVLATEIEGIQTERQSVRAKAAPASHISEILDAQSLDAIGRCFADALESEGGSETGELSVVAMQSALETALTLVLRPASAADGVSSQPEPLTETQFARVCVELNLQAAEPVDFALFAKAVQVAMLIIHPSNEEEGSSLDEAKTTEVDRVGDQFVHASGLSALNEQAAPAATVSGRQGVDVANAAHVEDLQATGENESER